MQMQYPLPARRPTQLATLAGLAVALLGTGCDVGGTPQGGGPRLETDSHASTAVTPPRDPARADGPGAQDPASEDDTRQDAAQLPNEVLLRQPGPAGDPGPAGAPPAPRPSRRCRDDELTPALCDRIEDALAAGYAHLTAPEAQVTAEKCGLMDIIHRLYDADELQAGAQLFERELQAAEGDEAARLRLLHRLLDPDAEVAAEDFDSLHFAVDRLTMPAAWCQAYALPLDFAGTLADARLEGGYAATHALMAMQFVRDNGCEAPFGEDEIGATADGLGALFSSAAADGEPVSDLTLEAAALLRQLRPESAEPDVFLGQVLDAQRADGGWTAVDPMDWHATALAVWYLNAVAYGASPEPLLVQ